MLYAAVLCVRSASGVGLLGLERLDGSSSGGEGGGSGSGSAAPASWDDGLNASLVANSSLAAWASSRSDHFSARHVAMYEMVTVLLLSVLRVGLIAASLYIANFEPSMALHDPSTDLPAFHEPSTDLPWPSTSLPLTLHGLPRAFHGPSVAFHEPSTDLPWPSTSLPLTCLGRVPQVHCLPRLWRRRPRRAAAAHHLAPAGGFRRRAPARVATRNRDDRVRPGARSALREARIEAPARRRRRGRPSAERHGPRRASPRLSGGRRGGRLHAARRPRRARRLERQDERALVRAVLAPTRDHPLGMAALHWARSGARAQLSPRSSSPERRSTNARSRPPNDLHWISISHRPPAGLSSLSAR